MQSRHGIGGPYVLIAYSVVDPGCSEKSSLKPCRTYHQTGEIPVGKSRFCCYIMYNAVGVASSLIKRPQLRHETQATTAYAVNALRQTFPVHLCLAAPRHVYTASAAINDMLP